MTQTLTVTGGGRWKPVKLGGKFIRSLTSYTNNMQGVPVPVRVNGKIVNLLENDELEVREGFKDFEFSCPSAPTLVGDVLVWEFQLEAEPVRGGAIVPVRDVTLSGSGTLDPAEVACMHGLYGLRQKQVVFTNLDAAALLKVVTLAALPGTTDDTPEEFDTLPGSTVFPRTNWTMETASRIGLWNNTAAPVDYEILTSYYRRAAVLTVI